MRIAFYGSSLLSSYWNGAATYYRGILHALSKCGHEIIFYEPDAFDRQMHRDIEPPDWARVEVYPASQDGVLRVLSQARNADVVIKASGVGVFDDELLDGILRFGRQDAIRLFWDVDAPATIATLRQDHNHVLRRRLKDLDAVLTYGGGPPVVKAYRELGARECIPIYNALDPETHFPPPTSQERVGDLGFLANRLPDREARVEAFFLAAAECAPIKSFILGGSGWDGKQMPVNVSKIGHVPTSHHNTFNNSVLAVLNVARDSMAEVGFSPATRVFEAAGAASCIITDSWPGIEQFFEPDVEILVARDGKEVAAQLAELTPARAEEIGRAALRRCLAEHTYAQRAALVHSLLQKLARQPGIQVNA